MTAIIDHFQRTVSNGWGRSDNGQSWQVISTASEYSVNGSKGVHALNTLSTNQSKMQTSLPADVDVTAICSAPAPTGGGTFEQALRARYVDDSNFVDVRIFRSTAGIVTLAVRQLLNGVETLVGTPTVSGVTSSSNISLRIQAVGTTIRGKAWLSSASEPLAWTSVLTNATMLSPGTVSVISVKTGTITNTLPINAGWDDVVTNNPSPMDDALDAGTVVWTGTTLQTDWRNDGFSPAYSQPLADNFDRVVSNGWGARTGTQDTWALVGGSTSDFSTDSSYGKISLGTVNVPRTAVTGRPVTNAYDVKFYVSTSALAVGAGQRIFVRPNFFDINNHYRFDLQFNTDQSVTWTINRVLVGSGVFLLTSGTAAGLTHAANLEFGVRVQTAPLAQSSMALRFKVWLASGTEPSAWNGTYTDNAPLAGGIGLSASLNSGYTGTLPVVAKFRAFTNVSTDLVPVGSYTVEQSLDDGMPSGVTDSSATGIPTIQGSLAAPPGWDYPASFYSPFRTDSPLYGLDRDIPALTADLGVVTSQGTQKSRLFTGQLADVPPNGLGADFQGVSGTRNKMRVSVQPPPINGQHWGLDSTWPVSWALWKSGVAVSPPASSGAKLYTPMHGGVHPYLPTTPMFNTLGGTTSFKQFQAKAGDAVLSWIRPTFIDGPFASALYCSLTTAENNHMGWSYVPVNYVDQNGLLKANGNENKGQWACYIRADVTASPVSSAPLGASVTDFLRFNFNAASGVTVTTGINTSRQMYITLNDGTNTRTFTGATIPSDGQWHMVSGAWDMTGNKLWLNYDGAITSNTPSPAIVTTNAQTASGPDVWVDGYPQMVSYFPLAELQIVGGLQADPATGGWVLAASWTPGAVVRSGVQKLVALAETTPREAFELVQSMALGELAWFGFDAQDRFMFLPLSYWAEDAQQTVTETLSTEVGVGTDLTAIRDVTKIFNQAGVQYKATTAQLTSSVAYAQSPGTYIPTGRTTLRIILDTPITRYIKFGGTFIPVVSIASTAPVQSYASANSASDGAGTNLDPTNATYIKIIDQQLESAGSIVLTIDNQSGIPWYLALGGGTNALGVVGSLVTRQDSTELSQDDASVAVRGVRYFPASMPEIQTQSHAAAMAAELVGRLSKPRTIVKGTVFGDPRRFPGSLIQCQDKVTGVSGLFRVVSVSTSVAGADVRQSFTAEEAWQVGVWGVSRWGRVLWGP